MGFRRSAYLPDDASPVSKPKVSILVAARSESRTLRRSLDSLLAQDYAEYEILIVDDHSEDDTLAARFLWRCPATR